MLNSVRAMLLLGTAGVLGSPPVAAAEWVEIKAPHFVVLSDAGEGRARELAWEFEQMRSLVGRVWPGAAVDPSPDFVVYGVRDEASMRALAPGLFEGGIEAHAAFGTAPYGHFIVVRADINFDPRRGPVDVVLTGYSSYVVLVLGCTFATDAPFWLVRGLTQVLSNIVVGENGLIVGTPIPYNVDRLRDKPAPSLDELLGATMESVSKENAARASALDAAAWALVHYLWLGDAGRHIPMFESFARKVAEGAAPTEALFETYRGRQRLTDALAASLARPTFVPQTIHLDKQADRAAFKRRTLPPAEIAVSLARLHAAMNRPVEARKQITAAGTAPAAAEVEGFLLETEGKGPAAAAAYRRASDAQAATFFREYRLALLSPLPDLNAPDRQQRLEWVEQRLVRATTLNPRFGPAHAHHALVLIQMGRPIQAERAAERAAALDLVDSGSHVALSQVYWTLGRRDEAKAAAHKALLFVLTDEERRQIDDLLQAYERASSSPVLFDAQKTQDVEACQKGEKAACARLMVYAEELCVQGHPPSCIVAAQARSEGFGLPRDDEKAMSYLEKPCDSNYYEACTLLATLHAQKQSKADLARAKALLDKSCKGGFAHACELLKDW